MIARSTCDGGAAGDADVGRGQAPAPRASLRKVTASCCAAAAAAADDLEVVDAVQRRVLQHQVAAVLLRAEVDHELRASVDELLRLLLLRLDDRVDDGDLQGRLLGGDVDRLHADQVGQPLLERRPGWPAAAPRRARRCWARRPAARCRCRRSGRFTRSPGEVNRICSIMSRMCVSRIGLRGVPGRVERVGEGEVHRASRRADPVCVTTGSSGVPVGAQIACAAHDHQRLPVGGDARGARRSTAR